MTDLQYFELYDALVSKIGSFGELDGELFYQIFEGKIKPIVYNSFSSHMSLFTSFDMEDLYQDMFVLLWKKSIPCYFLSDKYEKNASWYLGWCKVVCVNYVTSVLRRRSLRTSETLDDPDNPVTVSYTEKGYGTQINREAVSEIYRMVALLSSKTEMKLVWFGVYNLIYSGECEDKIEANHRFLETSLKKTLRDIFCDEANRFSQISGEEFDSEGALKIKGELLRERNGHPLSETVLEELTGDKPLAKISDWIYKINKKTADELPREVMEWNT